MDMDITATAHEDIDDGLIYATITTPEGCVVGTAVVAHDRINGGLTAIGDSIDAWADDDLAAEILADRLSVGEVLATIEDALLG